MDKIKGRSKSIFMSQTKSMQPSWITDYYTLAKDLCNES